MLERPYPVGQEPWRQLPAPYYDEGRGRYVPRWNSVALFFNLPSANRPAGYSDTTVDDALNILDEGPDRGNPTVSEFCTNYWAKLSYGRFGFGLNTPRDDRGRPLIPEISIPAGIPAEQQWGPSINACIDANAERIWAAVGAGDLRIDGRRWIPSVVLIQNYPNQASAPYRGSRRTVAGQEYEIGDNTHIPYDISFVNDPNTDPVPAVPPGTKIRRYLGWLSHEYAHNFLEFTDLYGPPGCTGYWDLLGDQSCPGNMSEVCSVHKELAGWLTPQVIQGPVFESTLFSLRPYTTTGEAMKVIPDPVNNPSEYFILEYRKSTSNELWTPDRALPEEGLLIIHINERVGLPETWYSRDAPYFDPEFADYSDYGRAMYSGYLRLRGILFPYSYTQPLVDSKTGQGVEETIVNNSFTTTTYPSSKFYGGLPSGLSITNIHVSGGQVSFQLAINCQTNIGWTVGNYDHCLAGRFRLESANRDEIFCRNLYSAALLQLRDAQWTVVTRYDNNIDGWNLYPRDREYVGDFDGDGRDEIFIRSPGSAGILKWLGIICRLVTIQRASLTTELQVPTSEKGQLTLNWRFDFPDIQLPIDLDGDGRDEILIRTGDTSSGAINRAGIIKMVNDRLQLLSVQDNEIDGWSLSPSDKTWSGFFTQTRNKEILIRSPGWLGLMYWDTNSTRLRMRFAEAGWIDGWALAGTDQHCIGDFDGDGLDEIYVRSP